MSSSISAVTSSQSAAIQAALQAAMQEASETVATTKKEAANGDQQAIRKLARQEQQQMQNSAPTLTSEPNADELVNYQA
jgi:hypothetical protein